MAEDKDYLGEKLHRVERTREDAYFRKLDQVLIAQMRQKDHEAMSAAAESPEMFASILVPVDCSTYSANVLRYAVGIADRFASSIIVLHVIPRETTTHAVYQHLGYRDLPFMFLDPVRPQSALAVPPEVAEDVVVDLREQAYTAL